MTPRRLLSRFALIALLSLAAQGHAQTVPAGRVLASFPGPRNDDEAPSHSGKWLLQSAAKRLSIYDVARKTSTNISDTRAWEMSWSPRDDAAVFIRGDDNDEGEYVWYLPIDGATGKPRGTPRRVTTGQAEYPSISSDGRFVAYSAKDSGNTHKLAVVPVNGGKERVVARLAGGFESINWSADDKFLFVSGTLPGMPVRSGVLKVSAAGGSPQLIGPDHVWLAGMTRDQRHLVTVPASSPVKQTDRAIMIDLEGREVARAALPLGEISEYAGVIGDSALVWVQIVDHKVINIREVDGGIRQLPLVGRSNVYPHWAPDGRRLAFLVQDAGRYSLAVGDASGGTPRVFRDTDVWAGEWTASWSPDSRTIAYETSDHHSIWFLDVATGTSRLVVRDSGYTPGLLAWRADGTGIRYSAGRVGTNGRGSVWDASLDTKPTELTRLAGLTGITFVGRDSLLVRDDSIASILALRTGARDRIAAIEPHTRIWTVGVSPDHMTVAAVLTPDNGRPRSQLEILSIAQRAGHTLDLPFVVDNFVHFPVFTVAGTSVLLFGKNAGDSTAKLYEVPLGGSNPRVIADIGTTPRDESVALSSSGRMAFTSQPDPSMYNLLIIPLREGAPKPASRRTPR